MDSMPPFNPLSSTHNFPGPGPSRHDVAAWARTRAIRSVGASQPDNVDRRSPAASPVTPLNISVGRRLHQLRVTGHTDSAIKDGVSETATFANGWLTKMIKARCTYSNHA
jgi:hypothetical protein